MLECDFCKKNIYLENWEKNLLYFKLLVVYGYLMNKGRDFILIILKINVRGMGVFLIILFGIISEIYFVYSLIL